VLLVDENLEDPLGSFFKCDGITMTAGCFTESSFSLLTYTLTSSLLSPITISRSCELYLAVVAVFVGPFTPLQDLLLDMVFCYKRFLCFLRMLYVAMTNYGGSFLKKEE
jgi:hypothetical protein